MASQNDPGTELGLFPEPPPEPEPEPFPEAEAAQVEDEAEAEPVPEPEPEPQPEQPQPEAQPVPEPEPEPVTTSGFRHISLPEKGTPSNPNLQKLLNIEQLVLDDSDSYDDDFDDEEDPEEEIGIRSSQNRLWRMLCTPLITILVGPSERHFHIHKSLLRRHSLFFRHMLRSDHFPEGKNRVVRLPEDDVTTFAAFAEWLYLGEECDTGAIFKDAHGKDNDTNDDDFLGFIGYYTFQPLHEKLQDPEKDSSQENTDTDSEDDSIWETGSTVDPLGAHDHYDFSLQFACYVLADKLQAPGFKRLILDEIRSYGEICDPAALTADHVQYVYDHTICENDPLRRFCIMVKCVRTPIEETLADDEFIELMERGGAFVRDVMKACRKQVMKQKKTLGKEPEKP